MKNRKKKLCPCCGGLLQLEKDKGLKHEYPYVCYHCDQNFYSFEARKTMNKKCDKLN